MAMKILTPLSYILSIVLVNWLFVALPLVEVPFDLGFWPPASLVVGAVFILRDYAQRAIGHWVIAAMLVGGALSYFLASPMVAYASVTAFLISQFADWAVYTWTKRPFRDRVILSSAVGTPIDSGIFLSMIGHFSIAGLVIMTLSKMAAALVIWRLLKK